MQTYVTCLLILVPVMIQSHDITSTTMRENVKSLLSEELMATKITLNHYRIVTTSAILIVSEYKKCDLKLNSK